MILFARCMLYRITSPDWRWPYESFMEYRSQPNTFE